MQNSYEKWRTFDFKSARRAYLAADSNLYKPKILFDKKYTADKKLKKN